MNSCAFSRLHAAAAAAAVDSLCNHLLPSATVPCLGVAVELSGAVCLNIECMFDMKRLGMLFPEKMAGA